MKGQCKRLFIRGDEAEIACKKSLGLSSGAPSNSHHHIICKVKIPLDEIGTVLGWILQGMISESKATQEKDQRPMYDQLAPADQSINPLRLVTSIVVRSAGALTSKVG